MIKKILCVKKTSIVRSGGRKFRFIVYSLVKNDIYFGLGIGRSYDIHKAINKSYLHALSKLNILYNSYSIVGKYLHYKVGKTIINIYSPLLNIGLIAGGYVRTIFDFIGIYNVFCSIKGSNNIYNVIIATYNALLNNNE